MTPHEYVYFRRDHSISPDGVRRVVWVGEHTGKMIVTSCCDTLEVCMEEMAAMIKSYDKANGIQTGGAA